MPDWGTSIVMKAFLRRKYTHPALPILYKKMKFDVSIGQSEKFSEKLLITGAPLPLTNAIGMAWGEWENFKQCFEFISDGGAPVTTVAVL